MKKTLGGDRLGGGKKMQVDMRTYNRSTHNKSFIWRSTMATGTIVPFLVELALPGSTKDIDLNVVVKTSPTIGPLFGKFEVRLDIFSGDLSLYNGVLKTNRQQFKPELVYLPQMAIAAPASIDAREHQINPSSLPAYLGIAGVGKGTDSEATIISRDFNGVPYLLYTDIYKNYFANQQEEEGCYLHTPVPTITQTITAINYSGTDTIAVAEWPSTGSILLEGLSNLFVGYTGTMPIPGIDFVITINGIQYNPIDVYQNYSTAIAGLISFTLIKDEFIGKTLQQWSYSNSTTPADTMPEIVRFPLTDIDDAIEDCIISTLQGSPWKLPWMGGGNDSPLKKPFEVNTTDGRTSFSYNQEGLLLKTHKSDLNMNWLNTEWMQEINTASSISTAGDSFTIDDLMFRRKLYDYMLRSAIAGQTYEDYVNVTWTVENAWRPNKPIYHGSLIREIIFDEVISNAASGDQPLGELAGRGIMGNKRKGGHITIKTREAGYVMGVATITPEIDYYQGNAFDMNFKTFDDLHKPAFDQIGFEDKITDTMHYLDTDIIDGNTIEYKSIGKQPAWINYMSRVNQIKGNFAIKNNQMFMTLAMRYNWDATNEEVTNFTTYIDPSMFNYIFADTRLDAQNFWVQIAIGMESRDVMSAKLMPTL